MNIRTLSSLLLIAALLMLAPHAVAQSPDPVWEASYFDNPVLSGSPLFTRTDREIAFDWGFGSPDGLSENEFSVRWAADVTFEEGTYRFWTYADNEIRIAIDYGAPIIDTFGDNLVDQVVRADVQLDEGVHHIQVDYREINSEAYAYVDFANTATAASEPGFSLPINPPAAGAWNAVYYPNPSLAGNPILERGEASPGGNWGTGAPLPSMSDNNWSARWTTTLTLEGGDYRISTTADDGVRVFADGLPVINEWHIAAGEEYDTIRNFAGGEHTFTVEYYEATGYARLDFDIQPINIPMTSATIASVTAGALNVRDLPNLDNSN